MSWFRKDENGNLVKTAGNLVQRFNDRLFQTIHIIKDNADYYEISQDAKKYITGLTNFTEFQLYISEPNITSDVYISYNGKTLKLNRIDNSEIAIGALYNRLHIYTLDTSDGNIWMDALLQPTPDTYRGIFTYAIQTFDASMIPTPKIGETLIALDTNLPYEYDGADWEITGETIEPLNGWYWMIEFFPDYYFGNGKIVWNGEMDAWNIYTANTPRPDENTIKTDKSNKFYVDHLKFPIVFEKGFDTIVYDGMEDVTVDIKLSNDSDNILKFGSDNGLYLQKSLDTFKDIINIICPDNEEPYLSSNFDKSMLTNNSIVKLNIEYDEGGATEYIPLISIVQDLEGEFDEDVYTYIYANDNCKVTFRVYTISEPDVTFTITYLNILSLISQKQDRILPTSNLELNKLTSKSITNTDTIITNHLQVNSKIKSNLTPYDNDTFALGSSAKAWKSIYLGDNKAIKFQTNRPNPDKPGEYLFINPIDIDSNEIRIKYADDANSNCIKILPDYIHIVNTNGKNMMELYNDRFNIFGHQSSNIYEGALQTVKLDSHNVRLDFEGTNGVIATNQEFNIIPNHGTFNKNLIYLEDYNRIKFGGREIVAENDLQDIIFAYKPASSYDRIVPFAITKDGKVYYNGKSLEDWITNK